MELNNCTEQTALECPDCAGTAAKAENENALNASEQQSGEPNAVSVYGKFDSLEQLLKGYASLEAEFTKRCQKLKELEKRSEARPMSEAEKEQIVESKLSDARFIAERIASDERISDMIISRYLSAVYRQRGAPILTGTGACALSPVKKPKSLEEAKRLADILLRG